MKKIAPTFVTAVALFALPGWAQEDAPMGPPQPAKELEKFSRLLGYWEGSGTLQHDPSSSAVKWTSSSHFRKVLGDHFIRRDASVLIEGDEVTTPLQFITFYGYDRQKKRFMKYGVSNMGNIESTEITWVDDDTFVTAGANFNQGKRVVERWVTKLGDDQASIVCHEAKNNGDFFVHVRGSARKVGPKPKAKIIEASHAFMARPSAEIGKLKGLVGTFRFKGEMLMMPGMPKMPISGESTGEFIFGGTVLLSRVKGDPIEGMEGPAYHGWHVMVWEPRDKNYVSLGVNSMGEAGVEKWTWASDTELVLNSRRPFYGGIPASHRSVMKCAGDGTLRSYTMDSMIGTQDPVQTFHITYTKQ
jgi:hypothetical protein